MRYLYGNSYLCLLCAGFVFGGALGHAAKGNVGWMLFDLAGCCVWLLNAKRCAEQE